MIKSIIRISILIALGVVALCGLFSQPLDESTTWFLDLFVSKAIGAGSIWALVKLYNRWKLSDKWIAAYDKACDAVDEAPNPMHLGKD